MGLFKFNKDLESDMAAVISQLEGLFQEIFQQMYLFQEEIDEHSGKAVAGLSKNLGNEVEFMSKHATALLSLADVIRSFVKTMELVDEGEAATVRNTARAKWQYTFSPTRIKKEVKLTKAALESAVKSFKKNLSNLDELFHKFDRMLFQLINETKFPWSDMDSVWPDAKRKIRVVVDEAKERLETLIKDAGVLVTELNRVDEMLAHGMAYPG